jgi:phage tail sheath protein FI
LSDAVDHGITVTEIAAMDQPVDVCPETTAALVGRALRGPLNTPVLLSNFGEFRRRFGDVWGRSSLGPAAKQFFEHGGKRLYVIRVANNARGAMLCLPASGSALVLRSVDPGSTEFIRAAVDYDGVDDDDDTHFNLTLQRVNPSNATVTDQEYFEKLSWREESVSCVVTELAASEMARVEHPYPTHRPEETTVVGRSYESAYVSHTQAGTDGSDLSDYDLIGSRRERTGLFALEQIDYFDLLYLPPPRKSRDLGPAAVLAAELYSRERSAMLIVDPSTEWTTAAMTVKAVRDLGYASSNMLGYYPRVRVRDSDDDVSRPVGGALAGLLCKHDRTYGPWQTLDQRGMGLHRSLGPEREISEEDQYTLTRAGLNILVPGPVGKARLVGSVTMGRGSEGNATFAKLPVRRFCLQVINTISRATRWAVFEPADSTLADRLRGQVLTYLDCLNDLGAFANNNFLVKCDAGVSNRADHDEHGITILLVFHPAGCDEPISLTLHQTASGFRVGSTAFGLSFRQVDV